MLLLKTLLPRLYFIYFCNILHMSLGTACGNQNKRERLKKVSLTLFPIVTKLYFQAYQEIKIVMKGYSWCVICVNLSQLSQRETKRCQIQIVARSFKKLIPNCYRVHIYSYIHILSIMLRRLIIIFLSFYLCELD